MIHRGVMSPIAFTILFALSRAVQAFHSGGYFANYMDLTQDYVGMLTGVGNTLASLSGVVVPQFVAFNLSESKDNWLPIAAAGVGCNSIACLLFLRFMSTACLDGRACGYRAQLIETNAPKAASKELSSY